MKRASFVALLASIAALFGVSPASAGGSSHGHAKATVAACDCDAAATGLACSNGCYAGSACLDDVCNLDCGRTNGFYTEAEALFFKYNRADGTRVGDAVGEDVDFDHQFAPRLTVGYVGDSGLGTRVRWFEYDEDDGAREGGVSALSVDTYTVDIEVFERLSLNRCWDLELSGGLRYNEFDEIMRDNDEDRLNSFSGWGGILGITASRNVGRWGGVYGRLRQAILVDEKHVLNENGVPTAVVLRDSIVGMTEIASGWEYTRETCGGSLVTLRAGYEWQLWHNYSSSFLGPENGGLAGEEIFTGPADVGFDGFTLSAAMQF